jgi:hypothetical protein
MLRDSREDPTLVYYPKCFWNGVQAFNFLAKYQVIRANHFIPDVDYFSPEASQERTDVGTSPHILIVVALHIYATPLISSKPISVRSLYFASPEFHPKLCAQQMSEC